MKTSLWRWYRPLTSVRKVRTLPRTHLFNQKTYFHANNSDTSCWSPKSNTASSAYEPFDETPEWDVVSATRSIGVLARRRQYKEAIGLFLTVLCLNIRPNEFTFGTVIPSATALGDLSLGRQLHACALKLGLHSIVFVGSALLNCYAKLSSIDEAHRAFEDIKEPNAVSYTSLIHGYLKKGQCEYALKLFREMPDRNSVVLWNAVIGGYSQMGFNEEAVNIFVEMLREGLMPNESTFPCAIIAAANIAAVGMGKSFHACAIKSLVNLDEFVSNALISFYAKCGCMEDSLLVFENLPGRSVVSWNAVICGLAQNGRGEDAVNFYERMIASGPRPNGVSLLGLLWACNHAGLVEKGYSYFNGVRLQNPSLLKPEHYACVVDLLSRCGRFKEAQRFICDLPFDPGIGFWKALLGGCQIHSNTEVGELAARKILALDPGDVASYIMLSNAHSAAGKWQDVLMIRKEMKERGMKKTPGCSWIEIKSKVHVFNNSDTSHPQEDEIYSILSFLTQQLRDIHDNSNFFPVEVLD